jgi:hypothetical protein
VVEAEDMPDIAANALSIAFGDFRAGYLVVDRTGVRVLRDPYSAKPYVLFYTTKRVGGGVQNFEAIKLIRLRRAETSCLPASSPRGEKGPVAEAARTTFPYPRRAEEGPQVSGATSCTGDEGATRHTLATNLRNPK